jgi:hypothetical protein
MAVTVVVVIKNVYLRRHRKGEFVAFRTSIQAPVSLTHVLAQKPDLAPVYHFVQH